MKIQIIFAIITSILMATGQVLFKKASIFNIQKESIGLIEKFVLNPWFLIGVLVFGISTITWVKALTGVNLSKIYPFASLAYIFAFILAYFIFGEKITINTLLGTTAIVIGLIIIGLGK